MSDRPDATPPADDDRKTASPATCPATCPAVCPRSSFDDAVLRGCRRVIRLSLRLLSILMALVIFWGVFDVVWVLWQRMSVNPLYLLNINDILATFGAFMAVLIAIEIFENIVMYLEEHVIQIKLVLATALMAAARKVIVLDFKEISPPYVLALAAVILALGVTYWLTTGQQGQKGQQGQNGRMPENRRPDKRLV